MARDPASCVSGRPPFHTDAEPEGRTIVPQIPEMRQLASETRKETDKTKFETARSG